MACFFVFDFNFCFCRGGSLPPSEPVSVFDEDRGMVTPGFLEGVAGPFAITRVVDLGVASGAVAGGISVVFCYFFMIGFGLSAGFGISFL